MPAIACYRYAIALLSVAKNGVLSPAIALLSPCYRVCVQPPYTPAAKALALEGGASLSMEVSQRIIEQTIQPGKRTASLQMGVSQRIIEAQITEVSKQPKPRHGKRTKAAPRCIGVQKECKRMIQKVIQR
jgi:hypothetical protein